MKRELKKSNNKVIAGVCAGLAEDMDADPNIVRVLAVVLTVFTSFLPFIILYAVCAFIMEDGDNTGDSNDMNLS